MVYGRGANFLNSRVLGAHPLNQTRHTIGDITMSELVKITFQGNRLWAYADWQDAGDTPLIPRHHVNEEYESMDWSQAFSSPTFAHAYFGDENRVMQYRTVIGSTDEIIEGWSEEY